MTTKKQKMRAHGASATPEGKIPAQRGPTKGQSLLKKELEEMTELAKRTMADLQNLRRRQEEERAQIIIMANVELIKQLLPSLDGLNRAKELIPEESKEYKEGLQMTIDQILKTLENAGLEEIKSEGETFNPDIHEALTQGPGKKDKIMEEIEKGYKIGDRVIRHAKVKVGDGTKENSTK